MTVLAPPAPDDLRPGSRLSDDELAERLRLALGSPPPDAASEPEEVDPYRFPAEMAFLGPRSAEVSRAGWGLVVPPGLDNGVRQALHPLLAHRKRQATGLFRDDQRMVVAEGADVDSFLDRNGADRGMVIPRRLPYHLLIVGSPEEISFDFQHLLDANYSVGRLHFPDEHGGHDFDAYRRYARAVVDHEKRPRRRPRATLFGVENDEVTRWVGRGVIAHLAADESWQGTWPVETVTGPDATLPRLERLLCEDAAPGVLFTAGHGARVPYEDPEERPRQERLQGALECAGGEHWLRADRFPEDADLTGLVPFLFACYSGGTPEHDSFPDRPDATPRRIAERPFVSALARKMLSHRKPALAVIGHVDRAWTDSFDWRRELPRDPEAKGQPTPFALALRALTAGHPVGYAMDFFGQAWSDLSNRMDDRVRTARNGAPEEWSRVARLWRARQDARGFAVFGDPAVRVGG
jgi:hypothetical protein